jgi:hypothetical protein
VGEQRDNKANWLTVINTPFHCISSNPTEGRDKLELTKQSSMDCGGSTQTAKRYQDVLPICHRPTARIAYYLLGVTSSVDNR